jgi:hypothetical protein
VTVRYPTLEDYLRAAAYVLDLPVVNGYEWTPPAGDDPDGEETFQQMRAIAAAENLEAVEAESPDGSPNGCTHVARRLTDRSDYAPTRCRRLGPVRD